MGNTSGLEFPTDRYVDKLGFYRHVLRIGRSHRQEFARDRLLDILDRLKLIICMPSRTFPKFAQFHPYAGSEPIACCFCSLHGDDSPKHPAYFFIGKDELQEYVCIDCAKPVADLDEVNLRPLQRKALQIKHLKLAALKGALFAAQDLTKGRVLTEASLARLCAETTERHTSEHWIKTRRPQIPSLPARAPLPQSYLVPITDFENRTHQHFFYWHCNTQAEVEILGLLNYYDQEYLLLDVDADESVVIARWLERLGDQFQWSFQFAYELLREQKKKLMGEYQHLKSKEELQPEDIQFVMKCHQACSHLVDLLEACGYETNAES